MRVEKRHAKALVDGAYNSGIDEAWHKALKPASLTDGSESYQARGPFHMGPSLHVRMHEGSC